MLMLDTNVLSEMMAATPDPIVAGWIVRQDSEQLFTASVCQAEILAGIGVLPSGRRRAMLEAAARAVFAEDFEGRVLPFDAGAAAAYAELFVARRRAGRPTGTIDLQLAAIARVQGASIVTRNIADFQGVGLQVIDPWSDAFA